ncbi:hypothetical protein J2T60_001308 [Natronospira proteinivora]|uniref:DUF4438 domain-containing protein n=1 Tax=Natronospira proteinivora TaxID=1807133 RepID=A0ABT1GAR1_9GAMM|nr:DUF4438 domain-containing protein [Natronospira proteinivora]MCP1727343.1 hypothetical protein [Natronospira proteinivora]
MRHHQSIQAASLLLACGLLVGCNTPAHGDVRPLEINENELVEQSVIGEITQPHQADPPLRVSPEGDVKTLPGTGGITYNFRAGDSAVHMAGDHVEPAVSIRNGDPGDTANHALNVMAQIGNRVRIIDGAAEGAEGRVIGKHGGINNVMVDFPDQVYDDLVIGDRMQIRTIGLGMEAENVDDVYIRNVSPALLEAMEERGMGVNEQGQLRIPVTHRIPAKIMGSGLGRNHVASGDYDIQFFDEEVVERYGLDSLRFGDIVAITDADHKYGRIYRGGAISVGVVVHGISRVAGHGPGVTSLFTSPSGNIELQDDEEMNLINLLSIH